MIEKFAASRGTVGSEFLDLNHTSKIVILVSPLIPKFARDTSIEVWRTSESGHQKAGGKVSVLGISGKETRPRQREC